MKYFSSLLFACMMMISLSSCELSSNKKKEFNIYATRDTLPTLIAALDLYHTKNESYIWFQRKGTLNTDYLPAHAQLLIPIGIPGEKIPNEPCGDIARAISRRIQHLNFHYPDAHFNLFVDDLWWSIALTLFIANNIPESRFSVKMIETGSSSINYGTYYNQPGAVEDWLLKSSELRTQTERLTKGDPALLKLIEDERDYKYEYIYHFAQRANVQYLMQYPESLKITDPFLESEIAKAHLVKTIPYQMYGDLEPDQKELFLKAVGANKAQLDREYFSLADGKPSLIISGTMPYHANLGHSRFNELFEKVLDRYGQQYHIVYKPHPTTTPEDLEILKHLLSGHNIKVFPQRTPIEVLFWVYPNLKIGGFDSSLFMAIPKESVLFIFSPGKIYLSSGLRYLFDVGIYKDIEFFWPH